MKLHELRPPEGSRKKRRRVGRGEGSGRGKTAGRGTKGQNARSGGGVSVGFEGGQMPLQRRIPKRGFTNIFGKKYEIINVKDLRSFASGETIDREKLREAGLVKKSVGLKLLGVGEISNPLTIRVDKVSRTAREKIEAVGGTVEVA
ncbi:MAG: 50S ribosomal protein L15 [Deltaproteobacteria bacterium]|nr:MAG: 50S ribosomal protein L15 [Deltaproteobacteria bacterium]